ncbi:NAD-dependent protein deacetylase sirtuin-6 [Desmophyllum pertusum]|uniref:protein acetyllysine N-acetyltransferase n=1 Tax=Desmophyllum pertusum TaxID=174260 RepID=A0A9W9ZXB4_9CNID|nr:NAD-dependent protein deacetylase sirtuin-6 [Desmophyllum pertusum]
MSVNYAAGLSYYPHKGKCGLPEVFDSPEQFDQKIAEFTKLVRDSKHIVFHTGAGVSTSAGIPDFRGPKGVWTLEEKGKTPQMETTFDDAKPSLTHMALVKLVEQNVVQYVVSQNVDGLHIKSGLSRSKISELHGNMFIEKCDRCEREYIRRNAVTTVGLKKTGRVCERKEEVAEICTQSDSDRAAILIVRQEEFLVQKRRNWINNCREQAILRWN